MGRLENIILKVRDTLADPNGERWPDTRLLRLVDEAQKEICRHAKLLRTKITFPIYLNEANYTLPDDLLLLDRVLYNNQVIPLKSHLQLDNEVDGWEGEFGKVEAVVFDKQNRGIIKLYKIPSELEGKDTYTSTTDYGVAAEVEGYLLNSDYGLVVDLDIGYYFDDYNSDYGLLIDWEVSVDYLTIYYIKKPIDITSLTDELEIDDAFDNAIKYYVTGKALRDDMDTQNRTVGNEELSFYKEELLHAIKDDEMDFTRNNSKQFYVEYKGVI